MYCVEWRAIGQILQMAHLSSMASSMGLFNELLMEAIFRVTNLDDAAGERDYPWCQTYSENFRLITI